MISTPVFGQYQDVQPPNTGGGVSLGGMQTSSVGNLPVMSMIKGMSKDGSEQVTVTYSPASPTSGTPLSVTITFTDAKGNLIQHQNYAISVTQDGTSLLSNNAGHTHTGMDTQTGGNLISSNPLNIQVTLNGIGLPGADPSTWTGPKGEVVSFQTVPEFGSLVSLVFLFAIIGIIAFTAKTRMTQRF